MKNMNRGLHKIFRKESRGPRLWLGGLLFGLGILIACPKALWADVFLLKGDRKVEGTAKEDGAYLIISTFEGKTLRVKKSDVLGTSPQPKRNKLFKSYWERVAKIKAKDATSHYELGVWLKSVALKKLARKHFLTALRVDPFHEGAGKALGRVRKNGRWVMSPDNAFQIGASSGPKSKTKPTDSKKANPKTDRARLALLAKKIDALELESLPDEAVKAMIEDARQRPEVFSKIMRAPGLKGGANIKNPVVRAKAAFLLGEGGSRKAMEALIQASIRDPDDRVRFAAARALPRLEEPVALRRLVDLAVHAKSAWVYRHLASIAVRRYGDKEAIDRLLMHLSFELAGGNARDPKNQLKKPTGGLGTDIPMGLPKGPPPSGNIKERVIYPVLTAIKEVTKMRFDSGEKDFKSWKLWWEKEKDKFKFNIR